MDEKSQAKPSDAPPRVADLEEKVEALNARIEQLTNLILQLAADKKAPADKKDDQP